MVPIKQREGRLSNSVIFFFLTFCYLLKKKQDNTFIICTEKRKYCNTAYAADHFKVKIILHLDSQIFFCQCTVKIYIEYKNNYILIHVNRDI